MATVYRINPVKDSQVTFTVRVLTAAGEQTVKLQGTVQEVAAKLRAIVCQPGFRKWRKVG